MGLNISSFMRILVVAGFGALFACSGAFAANCNPGQYYECGEDPYDNSCSECECVSCPAGQTSDGSGELYYCPNIYPTSPYGDTGCSDILCSADYVDCPAGVGAPGQRCKELTDACPSGSGCHEYELCNVANGAITYEVTGSCHIEEVAMCQPNSMACNQFPIESQFAYFSIVPNDQNGTAEWSLEKVAWNTINCKLNATNKNLSTITVMGHTLEIQCKNFNVMGEVRGETNQYRTKTVYDPVYYSLTRNYCAKCREGYLPKPQPSPDASVYYVPAGYDSSPYGVMFCDVLVSKPNYADGCEINFSLSNGTAAQNACKMPCPDNMETVVNGATSINDCVPTGATYNDSTGSFRLGSDSSLCTP